MTYSFHLFSHLSLAEVYSTAHAVGRPVPL